MVKVRRARSFGDGGDLAGVGQVAVDLVSEGLPAHAEHAVLGVQHDAGGRVEVVGHRGRLTDAQVDVGAGRDAAGHHGREFVAVQRPAVEVFDGRVEYTGHDAASWASDSTDRSNTRST